MKKKLTTTILFLLSAFIPRLYAQDSLEIHKLEQAIGIISSNYMDTISMHRLIEETIKAMFERLDPHSIYRSKNEAKDDFLNQPHQYIGSGIDFRMFDDTMTITDVIKNSPADKSGIIKGDKISFLNGKNVSGSRLKYPEIRDYLIKLYNSNDSIKLGVVRDKKTRVLKFAPSELPHKSIESAYAVNDSCIFVKINYFTFNTGQEFLNTLLKFKKKQRKNIILDLRDNPGGILTSCNQVCTHFFNEGIQIVNLRGQTYESGKSLFTEAGGLLTESRICVIINENSASSSEVIAGALQDWDRGIVVGRRSFGKGLVQQLFTLSDGSQIRITVSKLYTPCGRYIQKAYKMGEFNKYAGEILSRSLRGENTDEKKIPLQETGGIYHSIRLNRKLHAGLGIIPDVFVSEDTVNMPQFWQSWFSCGMIDNFILEDINRNRKYYEKKYSDYNKFVTNFIPDRVLERKIFFYSQTDTSTCTKISEKEFHRYCGQYTEISGQENAVLRQLKAHYALYLFGKDEYRKFLNIQDRDFLTALELINNYNAYQNVFNK